MVNGYQRLWTDAAKTNDEAKVVQILTEILTDKEGRSFILNLDRKKAKLCIEILDRGIANHDLKMVERQRFFAALKGLAARHGRLPGSMMITGKVRVEPEVLASGGFADVRRGTYRGHGVAVKALRVALKDDISKIRKQFCEEVVFWSTLSHPNVLKLAGVQGNMDTRQFITISEWMKHGNVMEYIEKHPVNRLELLYGAALGLEYLHGAKLTHGDLKGANILMSNDTPPRACLADFGFMKMVLDPDNPMSCSSHLDGGTLVFMSPELLAPQKFGINHQRPTPQSDVYAFGLVIFQVITGELPFRGFGPTGHIYPVIEGKRPDKPDNAPAIGFSDPLWAFTQRCWHADMKERPQVAEVVEHLGQASAEWNGVMAPHVKAERVVTDSQEPPSDTMKHREIFNQCTNIAQGTATGSRATSAIFSHRDPPSTQFTAVSQELHVNAPEIKPPPELADEPFYPHLNQRYNPPLSLLPRKKWISFRSLKQKFRKFFGLVEE
ncbi:kinase-like domain-containing protein [Thelephora terrestris]|uniref:Kinase-like domain-containing protein n=1 Tax=Thelephora terrestris TaxID=56493 RepID=A0A9P6HFY3_9AGAM|nr:kinase-like domain-containing protein [Thelephora terrestris]